MTMFVSQKTDPAATPGLNDYPNPILVAFREDVMDCAADLDGIAQEWMLHLTDAGYEVTHLGAHVDHARKVLTRLAALAERK